MAIYYLGNESTPAQCCATCGVHDDCSGLCQQGTHYVEKLSRSVAAPNKVICEQFLPTINKCWNSGILNFQMSNKTSESYNLLSLKCIC